MNPRAWIVIAALVGTSGAIAAPAPPIEPPEYIWQTTCGYCHGGPMRAVDLRGLGLPEEVILRTARAGAAGMPPFHPSELSDAELRALARWIARQPVPGITPAAIRPAKKGARR